MKDLSSFLNKNATVLLVGIGLIVVFPLLKGFNNLAKAVGDILSVPGDVIEFLKTAPQPVVDANKALLQYIVNNYEYKPGEQQSENVLYTIKNFNETNAWKNSMIAEFNRPKGIQAILRGVKKEYIIRDMPEFLKRQIENAY